MCPNSFSLLSAYRVHAAPPGATDARPSGPRFDAGESVEPGCCFVRFDCVDCEFFMAQTSPNNFHDSLTLLGGQSKVCALGRHRIERQPGNLMHGVNLGGVS